MERDLPTHSTWERYQILAHVVHGLSIRDRRDLFSVTRAMPGDTPYVDVFFPKHGLTLSEFAVWHTLGDRVRKKKDKV